MANILLFLSGVFLGAILGFGFGSCFKAVKMSDLELELYYKDQELYYKDQALEELTKALKEKQSKIQRLWDVYCSKSPAPHK